MMCRNKHIKRGFRFFFIVIIFFANVLKFVIDKTICLVRPAEAAIAG